MVHGIDSFREGLQPPMLGVCNLSLKAKVTSRRATNMTLKYDLLTLKITSGAIENDIIELAVLKNPDIDTDIIFLALLEVTLAQDSS